MSNKPYKLHPLIHAANLIDERLEVELAPLGIRPRQARVLNVLNLMGSASQAELAYEFEVTAASMSTMTSRLIAGGYVKRTVDGDASHLVKLRLTAKGAALIEPINEAWCAVDKAMDEAIGARGAHELAQWCADLRTSLGGRVAGAGTGYRYYEGTKAAQSVE